MPAPRGSKWEQWVESQIARLWQRSPFGNSGITLTGPGQFEVDGAMHVTGSMDVDGPIDVHGTANFDGDTTIGGNMAVTGTLSLPAGIIDNDALANPVTAVAAHASGDGFGLTTGPNEVKASATVAVPAGFTKALVQAFSAISAWNPTASADTLYIGCRINNPAGVDQNTGWSMPTTVQPSSQGAVAEASTAFITGLTAGQTFTIQTTASSQAAAWAAGGGNVANIDATIIWLR